MRSGGLSLRKQSGKELHRVNLLPSQETMKLELERIAPHLDLVQPQSEREPWRSVPHEGSDSSAYVWNLTPKSSTLQREWNPGSGIKGEEKETGRTTDLEDERGRTPIIQVSVQVQPRI